MSAATQNPAQLPETGVWTVDPYHSTVGFHLKHQAAGTFRGRFSQFEATYDASSGVLSGSVDAKSIKTFDMLDLELRSESFLDVARHPKIAFASTSVTNEGGALTIEGDLTMRDVTKACTLTGTLRGPSKVAGWDGPDSEHIGIDVAVTIDRRDFGIEFNSELFDGQMNLGWDVTLEFSLEFSTTIESA
ncbi:MAG TPA: YceI family protein [Baekduia sp.]|nr:YceI family protein [Baekduia sp.]